MDRLTATSTAWGADMASILEDAVLTPAFGMDYKTAKEAREAFLAGKDFTLHHFSGRTAYCSVRDFIKEEVDQATIRFDKLTKTTVVHA